jgi:hypothetical protein
MNAIHDERAGSGSKHQSDASATKQAAEGQALGPQVQRTTWFDSYDEEWEAFLAENLIRRGRSSDYKKVADALPCVWNEPPE